MVQSKTTIGSLVILGVPKNVYEITDDVMRRKLDERTGQPKFLAEVSNRACRYIFPYKRYPADVINRVCASKFGEMATLLQQHCNTNRAVVTTATVRTAVIARMLEATTTEDLKYILDQYRALATNSSHYSECIAAFNRRCERSRGVDTSSGASLAYAYMHFNPAYASRQKLPTFDQEEEINSIIEQYRSDYTRDAKAIAESESYRTRDAHTILIAHGIVASAAKVAVDMLRSTSARVGLWRPITLRPLDVPSLVSAVGNARRIIYIESALGQMSRLINDALIAYSETGKSFDLPAVRSRYAPALGITPTEIVEQVLKKS